MTAGWTKQKIGSLLSIQNGFAFDSKRFSTDDGVPLIRIRDLRNGLNTEIRFNGPYDGDYTVTSGDLLIGMDGEFACYRWSGEMALLNQRVCRLHRFSSALSSKFLYYGINKFLKDIEDHTGYTTVKHISSKQIAEIEFPTPPLAEQQRIVAILDEAFEGLAVAAANAEKNLKNARELFDSTLISTLTNGSKNLINRTLKEVAREFGRGKSKHRPRNDPRLYGGRYPFIQTGDVRNCQHYILTSTQTYNDVGLAQSKLWSKGTLCITIAANIAETGILGFDACFPDSIIGFVADEEEACTEYVEYLLRAYKSELQLQGKGSAQDNINLATFENQTFHSRALHRKGVLLGHSMRCRSTVRGLEMIYQRKVTWLGELKQSLLQKAFAGELS